QPRQALLLARKSGKEGAGKGQAAEGQAILGRCRVGRRRRGAGARRGGARGRGGPARRARRRGRWRRVRRVRRSCRRPGRGGGGGGGRRLKGPGKGFLGAPGGSAPASLRVRTRPEEAPLRGRSSSPASSSTTRVSGTSASGRSLS